MKGNGYNFAKMNVVMIGSNLYGIAEKDGSTCKVVKTRRFFSNCHYRRNKQKRNDGTISAALGLPRSGFGESPNCTRRNASKRFPQQHRNRHALRLSRGKNFTVHFA